MKLPGRDRSFWDNPMAPKPPPLIQDQPEPEPPEPPDRPDPSALFAPSRERCAELAAMPYKEYLETLEWKERRRVTINVAEHRCQRCGTLTDYLQVHHLSYERRGYEHPDDLEVLCDDCHRNAHGLE